MGKRSTEEGKVCSKVKERCRKEKRNVKGRGKEWRKIRSKEEEKGKDGSDRGKKWSKISE